MSDNDSTSADAQKMLPKPWRVERSRVLLENQWIKLRADDCRRADGLAIAPFYVLDYPDWVQIVAIDCSERLILVRQYRHGAQKITLELPSGCVDPDDIDVLAAGARELLEETGYASPNIRLIGEMFANPANHTNKIYILLAENAQRVADQRLDQSEDISIELRNLTSASDAFDCGILDHSAQIASLYQALAARKKNAMR